MRITGRFKGYFLSVHMANLSATGLALCSSLPRLSRRMSWSTKSTATVKLPTLIAHRDSAALLSAYCDTSVKNRVSFWSSTPNNLVFLPVDSAMASAHNGILHLACNAECPDLQQLLLSSQERIIIIWLYISVKAETHVMVLHTTCKFVMATPTYVTHRRTDRRTTKILMYCLLWAYS